MNTLNFEDISGFISTHMRQIYDHLAYIVKVVNLQDLIKDKNLYFLRYKNDHSVISHVTTFLEEYLTSEEEAMFDKFLQELAIFIASKTYNGYQSTFTGVDLEFEKTAIHYLVKIKSGIHREDDLQSENLITDFEYAKQVLETQNPHLTIQSVIGSYYGKAESHMTEDGIFKLSGQDFWYFISDDSDADLYTKIVAPIGYEAQKHSYDFAEAKSNRINLLFYEFAQQFCLPNGAIDWEKLIQFNSKNLPSPS